MILANSKNTSWIVGCVMWKTVRGPGRHDIPVVAHCDGRSYRMEEYAKERYDMLVNYYSDNGYSVEEIQNQGNGRYFGVQVSNEKGEFGVVYIDRNRVYTPY